MMEQLLIYVIAIAPSVVTIIGCIASCLKNASSCKSVVESFDAVKKEVVNTKEYEDLKVQLKVAHQDNLMLKKQISELVQTIDKVYKEQNSEE